MPVSAKTVSAFTLLLTFTLATSLGASEPRAYREIIHTVSAPDFLSDNMQYEIFSKALDESEILKTLNPHARVIIFVMTDRLMEIEGSAFLLRDVLQTPENQTRLVSLMGSHLYLESKQDTTKLKANQTLKMLSGECLEIRPVGNGLVVGAEARVTERHQVSNGYVYVIDRLLGMSLNSDGRKC